MLRAGLAELPCGLPARCCLAAQSKLARAASIVKHDDRPRTFAHGSSCLGPAQ